MTRQGTAGPDGSDSTTGELSKAVAQFLTMARVARLATAGPDGEPHNVPVCFCFDGARFYFVVDNKPKRRAGTEIKRMRNLIANPCVALLVDHYEEEWNHLAFVLVHGRAQVVESPEEYLFALRCLRDKYPQYREMALSPENNPVVRIDAERLHAWGARFMADAPAQPR